MNIDPRLTSTPHIAGFPAKFSDPHITAKGETRAHVALTSLETLWFNTGTLCNITCDNCYIESSPRNDRLAYLKRAEVQSFLHEAASLPEPPTEIGLTGGEPFMNPDILGIIEDGLAGGYRVLVLTNAMRPMRRVEAALLALNASYPGFLTVRVSLDHYAAEKHEKVRGAETWQPATEGLTWLGKNGFKLSVAGRKLWAETEEEMRAGYRGLFARLGVAIDAHDPAQLVLFPEMDTHVEVPEITEQCWGILGKSPESVMCANARMVVKRKGSPQPTVVACTLLPYDAAFELGATLADAARPVMLNHKYCAQFCVLGGASCSARA
jgi:hypothetical protein